MINATAQTVLQDFILMMSGYAKVIQWDVKFMTSIEKDVLYANLPTI